MQQPPHQALRNVIRSLDDENLTEHDIREKFENIKDTLFDAMLLIPEEKIADIKVSGFNEDEFKNKDYSKVADDIKLATDNIIKNYDKMPKEAKNKNKGDVLLTLSRELTNNVFNLSKFSFSSFLFAPLFISATP